MRKKIPASALALSVLFLICCSCDIPRYESEPYQPILRSDPDEADMFFNSGVAFSLMGRLEEAKEAFKRAVALRPDDEEAWFRLGNIYQEQGTIQLAEEAFAQALEGGFNRALHSHLGLAHMALDDYDRAIEEFTRALQADEPRPIKSMANLGFAYMMTERYERAAAIFESAIQDNPSAAQELNLYAFLGSAYQRAGDYDKAIESFHTSLELDLGFTYVLTNLITIYRERNDPDMAMKYMKMLQESEKAPE